MVKTLKSFKKFLFYYNKIHNILCHVNPSVWHIYIELLLRITFHGAVTHLSDKTTLESLISLKYLPKSLSCSPYISPWKLELIASLLWTICGKPVKIWISIKYSALIKENYLIVKRKLPFFLIVWLSNTVFCVVVKADGGAGISVTNWFL